MFDVFFTRLTLERVFLKGTKAFFCFIRLLWLKGTDEVVCFCGAHSTEL